MKNKYISTILTAARILTRRYFRDRTALFFAILFPVIFLVIFGGLYGSNNVSLKIAAINNSKSQFSYKFLGDLSQTGIFKLTNNSSLTSDESLLSTGRVDGIILLPKDFGTVKNGIPTGTVNVYYDNGDIESAQAISSAINGVLGGINASLTKYTPPLKVATVATNKKGGTGFDYIFSGMIGFTIIILGLLGPSRSIPEFKKLGILRRLHTTPLKAAQYVLASLISSVAVALISIVILFLIGLHFYHLDMTGNYGTLLIFLIISIATIFGFGLAIGGWAKSEEQAAPLTNLVSYPLMFLSGTFFPTYLMPEWLQNISHYLPLSPVIDGLRYIITENKSLFQLGPQLLIIGIWLIIIYVVSFVVFRWE